MWNVMHNSIKGLFKKKIRHHQELKNAMDKIRDPESEWGSCVSRAPSLSPPLATGVMQPSIFPSQSYRGLPQLSLLNSDVPKFPFT